MLFQTRIITPRIVLFQYAVPPDGKRFRIILDGWRASRS